MKRVAAKDKVYARVVAAYTPPSGQESAWLLPLLEGSLVELITPGPPGWLYGQLVNSMGHQGWFPAGAVEILVTSGAAKRTLGAEDSGTAGAEPNRHKATGTTGSDHGNLAAVELPSSLPVSLPALLPTSLPDSLPGFEDENSCVFDDIKQNHYTNLYVYIL